MKLALISLCHRSESSGISLLRARLWSKTFTAAISSWSSSQYCVPSTPSNVLLSAFIPLSGKAIEGHSTLLRSTYNVLMQLYYILRLCNNYLYFFMTCHVQQS
jgi:hypothetical protein